MYNISCLLLSVFLASVVESTVIKNPRDIIDEVNEQLDELKSIIQGTILAAHNDLSDLEYDFLTNGNNVMAEGTIAIEQEQATINNQITVLQDLANTVNADISSCTDVRQELLERLPAEYTNQLQSCISDKNKEVGTLVSDATYIVDVTFNKVHNLEFQVRQCREDILCITPLVSEIELDKIRLPQTINAEVNKIDTFLLILRLSVRECSDDSVSQYTADAISILQDITECVNRILG